MKLEQEGSVLIMALIILVVCSLMGVAATKTAEIELQIADNHQKAIKAFYNAESGISVVAAVNLYRDDIPNEYTDNLVMVEYLNEDDKPVFVEVTSTGYAPDKTHPRHGTSIVEVGFAVEKDWDTELNTALYVGNNLVSNGASSIVDGQADPDCQAEWDITSTSDADIDHEATDWAGGYGDDPKFGNDQPAAPFDELFNHFLKWAIEVSASNNLTLGSQDDPRQVYQIVDDDGNIRINKLDGYGVLLIEGDAKIDLGGNISWNGIVLVRGNLTFNGGGTQEVFGSVLVSGDVTDNGSVEVYWDCAVMEMLKEKYTKYQMTYWMQK